MTTYNIQALKAQQTEKAQQVILTDDFPEPKYIAGIDVGFENGGTVTRAAIVILTYPELDIVEYHIARINTVMPYIPGLLSFREIPAILKVWQMLQQQPDLVMVDGQGIAHPRKLGIASHLGVTLNIATIGVAKSRLCGQHDVLPEDVDSEVALMLKNEQIGWLWRSKKRCKPLFISPGHRISLNSALSYVKACTRGYRLPEPTRWADGIASNRTFFARLKQKYPDFPRKDVDI